MRVFLTVLGDSIRLLRARALFWVAIGISVLIGLLYLSIGFDEKGMTLLFGAFNFEESFVAKGSKGAELVYLSIFRTVIVGMWLSWAAIIIALISCAPIFPDFMQEGSSGVALSKPVSRPLLFFYKFIGALLFMAVQASLFAVIVYFAIGWRVGVWNASIFWCIPILLLVFSYIYAVLVLVGIKTKSVLASVLMAVVFWLLCFSLQLGEASAYQSHRHGIGFMGGTLSEEERKSAERNHKWINSVYTVMPKPGETTALLDRWIVLEDGKSLGGSILDAAARSGGLKGKEGAATADSMERHSAGWVIGTSLLFEAFILAVACRMFSRRDF